MSRARARKLKEHCRSVGRNYDDILKTRLAHLIIGEDEAEVSSLVQNHYSLLQRAHTIYATSTYDERVIYGTPEQVIRKIQESIDAGIQYFIFSLDFSNEEKMLRIFARKVMPKFL